MGKTAFSGPVYGAKSLIWAGVIDNTAFSSVAQTVSAMALPAGADWYITDFSVYRGSTFSTAFVARLADDSTVIADVAITSSAAAQTASTALTRDAGEYEGLRVAAGSVLSVTLQNGNSTAAGSSQVHWSVFGYPRWLQTSTRGF